MRINDLVVIKKEDSLHFTRVGVVEKRSGRYHLIRICGQESGAWLSDEDVIIINEFREHIMDLQDAIGFAPSDPVVCINEAIKILNASAKP